MEIRPSIRNKELILYLIYCQFLKWLLRGMCIRCQCFPLAWAGSSVDIATGYGLDGPGIASRWGRDFPPVQTGPGAQPASCRVDTGSFPGAKSGRVVTLTTHPLLVPWSRKSRTIPVLRLWAVRPVQNLSVCTTVHFTFTYTSTSPMSRTACIEPQCLYNGALYLYLYFAYEPYGLYKASMPLQWCTLPFCYPFPLPLHECVRRRHSTLTCCYFRSWTWPTGINNISDSEPREFGTKMRRFKRFCPIGGDRANFFSGRF